MPDRTYVEIDGGDRRNDPVAQWLIEDAWRLRRTADLIEQLAERMAGAAFPCSGSSIS